MPTYSNDSYPFQEETKLLIGIGYDIHNQLGKGFLEIVYKDAFEHELRCRAIPFAREKKYDINYKGIILPHAFFADFVVFDNIILEIKSAEIIAAAHIAQTLNYLKASSCKIGLVLNFGETQLKIKRLAL